MRRSSILIVFMLGLFLVSAFARAATPADTRRNELGQIVDEELKEIIRLNKAKRGSDPQLLLRMGELYLEKARITKENEMAKFMEIDPSKRSAVDKTKFFASSTRFFVEAQKICRVILERFPNFKDKADVYYVLAYNAKEFQDGNKALKYFQMAVQGSDEGSPVNRKSKIALAEMYYLRGDYPKATPLYATALKGDKDKWWTKDSYNLAWCYFRQERYEEAISTMKAVYERSKDKDFVDMSYNSTKDLAYFYSAAGQPQKAVDFYKTVGGDVSGNLYRVAKHLLNYGKFTIAETLLTEAAKASPDAKNSVRIHMELLALYEKYGKVSEHLKTCQNLTVQAQNKLLDEDDLDVLKIQALKMSALLQQQVASKTYDKQPEVKVAKANASVSYFKLLAQLEPKKAHEHFFHAAESLYASERFNDALPLYEQAQVLATKAGDKKTRELAMTGLMASLGQKDVSKENEAKYLIEAFAVYLKTNPKTQKSFTIYQRLFSAQMEKKDIVGAEKTMVAFKQNFPEAVDKQEAMLARVIDYYKEKGDKTNIKNWVSKIGSGEFQVSAPVAKKIRMLMLSMQFDNVEAATSKGDKSKALRLYVDIYKDKESSPEAKKNAAYNIMTLFYQLGDMPKMYAWGERALQHMDEDDVQKFEGSFLLVTAELYNRRQFKESAYLDEVVLKKLCSKSSRNKDVFFKNAAIIHLAESRIEEAREISKNALRCGISSNVMVEVQLDILDSLAETERWNSYEDQINQLESNPKAWPELIRHIEKLIGAYEGSGKSEKSAQLKARMMKLYEGCKKEKIDIPLLSLDAIARIRLDELQREEDALNGILLAFPEKTYNDRLKAKFKQLDQLTTRAFDILNIGSGVGIVHAYRILVENYRKTANQIKDFIPPEKGPEYVESFRKGMTNIYSSLFNKADEFVVEARKQIDSSKILSSENNWFLMQGISNFKPEYEYRSGGVLMDRGGRR